MELVYAFTVALIIYLFITLLLMYLFDVNYFLRVVVTFISAYCRKRPLDFLESSTIYGRVLPFDSDVQILHMNNARALREFDFGRLDLWTRVGLLDDHLENLKKFSIKPVYATASVIRYRRPLHMFAKYKIVSRIAYWEGRVAYQEQKIVTVVDDITRCLGYNKVIFPYNLDDFVKHRYPHVTKPTPPKDLELWMKYNEANGMNTQIKDSNEVNGQEDIDGWSSCSNN